MNNKIFVETISNLSNNKVYLSSDDNGVARGGFLIMNNKNSFQNNYHEYKNKIDFRKMLNNTIIFGKIISQSTKPSAAIYINCLSSNVTRIFAN